MTGQLDRLEDELTESLGKAMSESIDFEVLCSVYVPEGWTRIETKYVACNEAEWAEIIGWVNSNFTGAYRENCGVWLIERPEDATMFMLRWV
jgi:hypothetical protein